RGFDFFERGAVALGGARDAFRVDAFHFLELIAERLPDADRFAGEPDLEAANLRIAQAIARRQSRRGGNTVAHAVLHELGPALAPQVGRNLAAVDAGDPLGELLRALRDAPVRLTDAKHGVLVAALCDRAANPAGFVEVDRDHRRDDADGSPPSDDARDRFFVQAVLQRDDEALGREIRRDQ